jgi:hypothetical protein
MAAAGVARVAIPELTPNSRSSYRLLLMADLKPNILSSVRHHAGSCAIPKRLPESGRCNIGPTTSTRTDFLNPDLGENYEE